MKLIAKFEIGASTITAETICNGNSAATRPTADDVPAAAKNLALAYRVADLIDRGLVADFTAAARLLGVSQPRLTHVMSLMLIAPQIQEALLFGTIKVGDKALRKVARIAEWREQLAAVAQA